MHRSSPVLSHCWEGLTAIAQRLLPGASDGIEKINVQIVQAQKSYDNALSVRPRSAKSESNAGLYQKLIADLEEQKGLLIKNFFAGQGLFEVQISDPKLAEAMYLYVKRTDAQAKNFIARFCALSIDDRQKVIDNLSLIKVIAVDGRSSRYMGTFSVGQSAVNALEAVIAQLPQNQNDILLTMQAIEKTSLLGLARAFPGAPLNLNGIDRSQLKIDSSNVVELSADGIPDLTTWIAAKTAVDVEIINPSFLGMPKEEKALAEKLIAAYENTRKIIYSGRNKLLLNMTYIEPWYPVGGVQNENNRIRPLDSIVNQRRYLLEPWWMDSQKSGFTKITNKTSGGAFANPNGPPTTRTIFWSTIAIGKPLFDQIRIAVTKNAAGEETSLELMSRNVDGRWEPFLYTNVGGEWIPQARVAGVPVRQFCMECHVDRFGEVSPRPKFLKSEEAFIARGYLDHAQIRTLMSY
jgi:hypothetical protein